MYKAFLASWENLAERLILSVVYLLHDSCIIQIYFIFPLIRAHQILNKVVIKRERERERERERGGGGGGYK